MALQLIIKSIPPLPLFPLSSPSLPPPPFFPLPIYSLSFSPPLYPPLPLCPLLLSSPLSLHLFLLVIRNRIIVAIVVARATSATQFPAAPALVHALKKLCYK